MPHAVVMPVAVTGPVMVTAVAAVGAAVAVAVRCKFDVSVFFACGCVEVQAFRFVAVWLWGVPGWQKFFPTP